MKEELEMDVIRMTRTIRTTSMLAIILLTVTMTAPLMTMMATNHANNQATTTPINKPPTEAKRAPLPTVQQEWNYSTGIYGGSVHAIADVDGDGKIEVLEGYDNEYAALNGSTGELLHEYIDGGEVSFSFGESAAVAELFGNGTLYVLYVLGGHLYWFNGGTGEEVLPYAGYGSLTGTPAVGDINGTGKLDVVVGDYNGYVYCYNGTTSDEKWQYPAEGTLASSPTLVDINNDGKLEVLVHSANSTGYDSLQCLTGTATGGFVHALWSYNISQALGTTYSSPAVADIDSDGHMEVFWGSSDNNLYCISDTGAFKWCYATEGQIHSSPTIADIDGDGKLEVMVGSDDSYIYCLDWAGDPKWSYYMGAAVQSSVAVADLDGDKQLEALVGSTNGFLYCVNRTGGLEWTYATGGSISSSPAVADTDGDNQLEVVFEAEDGYAYCLSVVSAPFVPSAYPWPSIGNREDIRNTGCITDSDGDGLTDNYEITAGTDPGLADTDGDTATDYQEFQRSTNPLVDTVPPATVTNLATTVSTGTSVTLTWTAPGNNSMSRNATGYWLKYSTSGVITTDDWGSATNYTQSWKPAKNGTQDTGVVTDLISDSRYWFAIKAYDEAHNYGNMSNCATGTTMDVIPPATITNLAAGSATDTSITLTWTAPGDDGNKGNATGYWVKYSTSGVITAANWASATNYTQSPLWVPAKNGTAESHAISGLTPHARYWFAIKASDETPSFGGVSNSPDIWTTITGWQSNETVNLIPGAGNNATMPSGSFEEFGFTLTTNNATNVSVTFASSRPPATGAPIPGLTSFLYLDISGTQISGTTGVAIYVYYNRTLVQSLGIDELAMQIYRWNATTSQWYAIQSSVTILDDTHGVIVAYLDHFSYFAVFGTPAGGAGNPASLLVIVIAAGAVMIVVVAIVFVKRRTVQVKKRKK